VVVTRRRWTSRSSETTRETPSSPAACCCAAATSDYDAGYTPEFAVATTSRAIVHPQHWPEDLDYAGKRVVVIGSGATAVTPVPAMAEKAAHVTMLQRSPSYLLALPARDPICPRVARVAAADRDAPHTTVMRPECVVVRSVPALPRAARRCCGG
jgi:cation diffusion facilitator CzcD-associated flavoprotein CzcO